MTSTEESHDVKGCEKEDAATLVAGPKPKLT